MKLIRLSELKGEDEDILLSFLYELERRDMLRSKLETTADGTKDERVWYSCDFSEEKVTKE